jgi:hypothetical protein
MTRIWVGSKRNGSGFTGLRDDYDLGGDVAGIGRNGEKEGLGG